MPDYRKHMYLGSSPEAKALYDAIERLGRAMIFKGSEGEFLRHCIRFTLANDPQVKALERRAKKLEARS